MEEQTYLPSQITLARFSSQPETRGNRGFLTLTRNYPSAHAYSSPQANQQKKRKTNPLLLSRQAESQKDHSISLQPLPQLNRASSARTFNSPMPSPEVQSNLFAFWQEGLRGSRLLQIPSTSELPEPELNRFPSRTSNGRVIIPIQHLEEAQNSEDEASVREQENENPERQLEHDQEQQLQLQQQADESEFHDESITKTANYRVGLQFFFNLYLLVSYILGYMVVQGTIEFQVILGATLGFLLIYMFFLIKTKGFSARGETSTVNVVLAVGNSFALVIYLTGAILKLEGYEVDLTPFTALGGLSLFCSCFKVSFESPGPTDIFFLMDKAVIWIELFLIALRADGLEIPWTTVFIPLYFVLMILVFSSFLIIFGSFFAFFGVIREEGASAKLFVGSIWYILVALYTAIWLGVANETGKELDDGSSNILYLLKVGVVHSGVLFLYTLVFWRLLCKFQEFEVQGEMLEADDLGDYGISEEGHQNIRIKFQVSKEEGTNLVMISPTFFTLFKKSKKNRSDRQLESIKRDIKNSKAGHVHQNLALNMPYASDKPVPEHFVFSPTKQTPKNLDFSEGDIQIRKHQPQPLILKRGESTQSGQSNENLCTICFDNMSNAVCMDCGHGGICYECALESWKKNDNCILCRQKINKILKIVIIKPLNVIKVLESTKKIIEPI